MLPNTITISFVPEGATESADKTYDKVAHDFDVAKYVDTSWKADPSLPQHTLKFVPTAPKTSKNFYGTSRGDIQVTVEETVPSPIGVDTKVLSSFRLKTSMPVGMTGEQIKARYREALALLGSDEALSHIMSRET